MNQQAILIPFFGVMILTLLVWVYMYYQRLSFIKHNKIDPQSLATSEDALKLIPPKINTPSENLINLFELPVLFYATCLYLYVSEQVGTYSLVLAYGFLLFRIGHSVIHCTYNKVMHRFYFYMISSIILWVLIIMAFAGAVKS